MNSAEIVLPVMVALRDAGVNAHVGSERPPSFYGAFKITNVTVTAKISYS